MEEQARALEQAQREITLLRQKLDTLARRFFGQKSEQLSESQLELLLSGLARVVVELTPEEKESPARLAPPRSPSHSQRLRTPDNLEVVREVIEPHAYLKDVLKCLPATTNQQVQTLAPLNWQKERQAEG